MLLRPVFLTLKPLVPRLRSYPEYTPSHQALQVAAKSGRLDAVRLLLEHGADVNAPPLADLCEFGGKARTALQAAAESGNLELVRCLLDVGADVESRVRSPREEGTALRFAAMIGSISIVTLLIQEGADVNAPAIGEYGRTPVEEAAEEGRLDTVQLLIDMGADSAGSSALNYARSRGHDGVVALLLENGFEYQKNVYGLWNDYDDE
jgi:ankyrin repeat protein